MIACLNWAHNCHSGFSFSCLLSYLLHYFIIISFCSFFDLSFFHVGIYCLEVDLLIIFRLLVQSSMFSGGFQSSQKTCFGFLCYWRKGFRQICSFALFLFFVLSSKQSCIFFFICSLADKIFYLFLLVLFCIQIVSLLPNIDQCWKFFQIQVKMIA